MTDEIFSVNDPAAPPQRLDISDAEDVVCDQCGDRRFEPVYLIKKLSPLISPTGRAEIIPLVPPVVPQIFACLLCGHINEAFLPVALRTVVPSSTGATSAPAKPTLVKE